MSDVILGIIARECKSACRGEADFEERIRKSMKLVIGGHWLTLDEDFCFRGAVGGVLISEETTDEEKERLTSAISAIRSINALVSGVPVDLETLAENLKESELAPIVKIWKETKVAYESLRKVIR